MTSLASFFTVKSIFAHYYSAEYRFSKVACCECCRGLRNYALYRWQQSFLQ